MESSESKSIKRFYDGAEIFITGGSGFIGKVLIEKLLRSCDGVKAIYLLMRPNKGENPAQRLRKLTDNLVSWSLGWKWKFRNHSAIRLAVREVE